MHGAQPQPPRCREPWPSTACTQQPLCAALAMAQCRPRARMALICTKQGPQSLLEMSELDGSPTRVPIQH